MNCPYCKGEIPDDAMKCMHCGEWVKDRPAAPLASSARTPGEMFGRVWRGRLTQDDVVEGVRWYVKYRIVMAVVGAIVGFIFLVTVIIPGLAGSGANDPFGPPGGGGITCHNSEPTFGPDGIPTCVR